MAFCRFWKTLCNIKITLAVFQLAARFFDFSCLRYSAINTVMPTYFDTLRLNLLVMLQDGVYCAITVHYHHPYILGVLTFFVSFTSWQITKQQLTPSFWWSTKIYPLVHNFVAPCGNLNKKKVLSTWTRKFSVSWIVLQLHKNTYLCGFKVLHDWKLKFDSVCKSVNLPPG